MALIDEISDEILLYIFRIYVWRNQDTPHRLLRVSKRWYGLAVDSPSLWGNILISPQMDPVKSKRTMSENKILCKTEQSLKLAIERTGTSPFELTVFSFQTSFLSSVWDFVHAAVSQRCRALMFSDIESLSLTTGITSLIALERLVIEELLETSSHMEYLSAVVNRTATRFQQLEVDIVSNDLDLWLYSGVFYRLKSLQIVVDEDESLDGMTIAQAPALKQLSLHIVVQTKPVRLDAALLALQRLRITEPDFFKISWGRYTRLTHLWVTTTRKFDSIEILTFPALLYLMIAKNWSILGCIKAPALESLSLRDTRMHSIRSLLALEATVLCPRSLEIDISVGGENLIRLLQGRWQDIEILQLRSKKKGGISKSLIDAFINEKPFCQNLIELVVLCTNSVQETIGLQLTEIAEDQRTWNRLQRIRFGTLRGIRNMLMPPWHMNDEPTTWTTVMAQEAYSTPSFWHDQSCYDGCHQQALV